MNVQLHDILSNPVLLKDVSDETLQSWIQQYPYVSLFHLYALKNKKKYSETDLHKTAFYFNNREKLYFLLNDRQFESKTIPTYEKINTVPPPVEIQQVFVEDEKISTPHIEETAEPEKEEEIITQTDNEAEVEHQEVTIEETTEDTVDTEHSEQQIAIVEEPIVHDEITVTENISAEDEIFIPVAELLSEKQEVTETVIPVIPVIADNQPLSIADKILLEIQQLKEERARKEKKTEVIEEETIETPELETIEEVIVSVEEKSEEETDKIIEHETVEENEIIEEKEAEVEDIKAKVEETTEVPVEEKTLSIQEEVIARIQKIKEERELKITEEDNLTSAIEEIKEDTIVPEIIETTEEKLEEITETLLPVPEPTLEDKQEKIEKIKTETTEKPLSIQEEVIARIQKIKEERERRLAEEKNITPVIEETKLETAVPEIIETAVEKTDEVAETPLPLIETTLEDKEEETTKTETTTTEKVLSIQDEIIARIQQIKDERAQKLAEENNLTTQEEIKTEIPAEEIIEVPETISEITSVNKESETNAEKLTEEEKTENISDIKIVEKTVRPFIEIADEKNPMEEMLNISSTDTHEKDIELIESKLLPEIEAEFNDVDALADIHQPVHIAVQESEEIHAETSITDILPHPEEELTEQTEESILAENDMEETEADRFAAAFPAPLLVQVDTSQLKSEITPVTIEQLQEETIVPIKEIVENKIVEPETVIEIIEEKLQDSSIEKQETSEIIEHTSLISKKSDLFIPNVEEDIIEAENEDKSSKEEVQHSTLNIQHLKEEPHTFIEWLKLLDGNLQIQTTEAPKEIDNWIEIPRYEVEQAIANKAEIRKEEQKLFEPNFEEGEVDLFNEIDEEVTKVASESVSFKQDMMTETLARIYEKQGKTDKALEIYNTLLMKFPEKSAYFASLIQKIEKEK